MSDAVRSQWTIVAQTAPQPWLNCQRCGETRPFRSSGKLRVNANGRRLDVWLVYKCTACEGTWNRPVLERQPVRTALAALRTDPSSLVRRLEFDGAGLRRHTRRVDEFDDVVVSRDRMPEALAAFRHQEILCIVPQPTGLRLDRLLANELQVSRTRVQALAKTGGVVVLGEGSRALARPVRHGLRVAVDLAALRA